MLTTGTNEIKKVKVIKAMCCW